MLLSRGRGLQAGQWASARPPPRPASPLGRARTSRPAARRWRKSFSAADRALGRRSGCSHRDWPSFAAGSPAARACEALGADPELRGARGGDPGVQPGLGVGARRGSGGRSWHEATELRADRRRRGARRWVLLGSERLRWRWDCCCAPGWDARALRGAEATGSQGSSRTMLLDVRAQPSATASGTC